MLYREIVAVCSEICTEHINTLCGQNVELLNVKLGGTYRNYRTLKFQMDQTNITVYYTKCYWISRVCTLCSDANRT